MNREQKSNIKKIISVIFAFFMSVFLFLLAALIIINSTLFSQQYIKGKMVSSNYAEKLTGEIREEFVSYGAASGFDETFFNSVLSVDIVYKDLDTTLNNLYRGEKQALQVGTLEKELLQKFTNYVNEQGGTITPEIQEAIEYLTANCVKSYQDHIQLPYADQIYSMMQKAKNPLNILMTILAVLTVILALFVFFLNHWRHRAVRYYIYTFSASALMCLALPAFFALSGKIHKVAITSPSLRGLVITAFNGTSLAFIAAAGIFSFIVLLLALFYRHIKNNIT